MSARQRNAQDTVRNWNETFAVGVTVIFDGRQRKTWSHAGLGMKDAPSVFLEGDPVEPVPLERLTVPGYVMNPVDRRKRPNESPGAA